MWGPMSWQREDTTALQSDCQQTLLYSAAESTRSDLHHIRRWGARRRRAACRTSAWGFEFLKVQSKITAATRIYIKQSSEAEALMRILLPMRETRRDTGRGLLKTNMESRHSWRMKLLRGKGRQSGVNRVDTGTKKYSEPGDSPEQPGISRQSGDGNANVVVNVEDLLLVCGQFGLGSLHKRTTADRFVFRRVLRQTHFWSYL